MPIKQNFIAYQQSITKELHAAKDRIRNLIGDAHWQTDGEHKEEILRTIFRNHLPETKRVSKGFICYPPSNFFVNIDENEKSSSGQIDILITNKNKPTLYKQGDLVFVTADSVEGLIEVKTKLYRGDNADNKNSVRYVLNKLADEAEKIRSGNLQNNCWLGLFVFEKGDIIKEDLLHALYLVSEKKKNRIINFIAFGPNIFIRFWEEGSIVESPKNGPVWHLYEIDELAPTYFINNFVFELYPYIPTNQQSAWFPIEGTKETRRKLYISLEDGIVNEFDTN